MANEQTTPPTQQQPQPQKLVPDAVALHYQSSATFWEQKALALQNALVLVTAEREVLIDELERLKNPPVVVKQPEGQV